MDRGTEHSPPRLCRRTGRRRGFSGCTRDQAPRTVATGQHPKTLMDGAQGKASLALQANTLTVRPPSLPRLPLLLLMGKLRQPRTLSKVRTAAGALVSQERGCPHEMPLMSWGLLGARQSWAGCQPPGAQDSVTAWGDKDCGLVTRLLRIKCTNSASGLPWWHSPIIPVTWEAEAGNSQI